MSSLFDDLDRIGVRKTKQAPFFTVDSEDEKELLTWLKEAFETAQATQMPLFQIMKDNLLTYKGDDARATAQTATALRNSEGLSRSKSPRLIVNHLYEITENLVSKMNRIKPAVEVLPTNDEYTDKNAAKAVKFLVEHLWYINDMDRIMQQIHRLKYIFGEAFLFITWDENAGDIHPAYVAAKQADAMLNMVDENGDPILDNDGNPRYIDFPVKTGDVKYEVELPWKVLLQEKSKMEEVEWCMRVSSSHIEELKKDYPEKAKELKSDTNGALWDVDPLEPSLPEDHVIVVEFFHKPTKYLPVGAHIKFTKTCVLMEEDYPYSHGQLPFERLTDIDIPAKLRGVSFYDQVRQIQQMHNNLSTQIAKNHFLVSSPKWVMPRGAAKIEQLGNDITVVQYQGPVPPQLVQMNPTPPEIFNFREKLKEELETLSGVFGISRGEPPKGVTAAVAMQFLNEQETERATTAIAKHNNFVRNMAIKTVGVAGDFYQPDDGRLLRILGKDNAYMLEALDTANLQRDYDIRINTSSALPQSKAAKLERILQVMQYKPELLSDERWVDLLDFGQDEKMTTLITAAVRAAESENEDIISGKPFGPAEEWEDHLTHWDVHVKAIQSRYFKEEVPEELRHLMMDHIELHEFLMVEQAKQNPTYEAQLAALPMFPLFLATDFRPRTMEQQIAEAQTQAQMPKE